MTMLPEVIIVRFARKEKLAEEEDTSEDEDFEEDESEEEGRLIFILSFSIRS